MRKKFGMYLHIPFCRQKCFYCDFPSFAGKEKSIDSYLEALGLEFCLLGQKLHEAASQKIESSALLGGSEKLCAETSCLDENEKFSPRTIYIGGGTPTALDCNQLRELLRIVRKYIAVEKAEEFTVEMNPGTADREKLLLLREAGVNRISVGVQSFADDILKGIGRIHTASEAVDTIELAHRLGFENISLDLMYGLPRQNMDVLQESVERALTLPIRHISVYGLQLEEGTAFARMADMGRLPLPDDELVEEMYDYIAARLPQAGYQRYEISNYALPGCESRHNLAYWQDVDYLGLGSGAHSYWQGVRYENPQEIDTYIETVNQGHMPCLLEERVDKKAHMEEFCFLGLRTAAGIDADEFQRKFAVDLSEVYGAVVEKLTAQKLLRQTERGIALTAQGMKYGNQVFAEFLL